MDNYNQYNCKEYSNINIIVEDYCLNNKLHRIDGPAIVIRTHDKLTITERYYLHGKRHRLEGPADIEYFEDGGVIRGVYYILGEFVTKEEFETPGFIDSFLLEHS